MDGYQATSPVPNKGLLLGIDWHRATIGMTGNAALLTDSNSKGDIAFSTSGLARFTAYRDTNSRTAASCRHYTASSSSTPSGRTAQPSPSSGSKCFQAPALRGGRSARGGAHRHVFQLGLEVNDLRQRYAFGATALLDDEHILLRQIGL